MEWPPLAALKAAAGRHPSRTGSVIVSVFGDAILPRGGVLAIPDLLALMRHIGLGESVVRTALSRLARGGVLQARRTGRSGAYALTATATAEFLAAVPRIYGAAAVGDGKLRLAFPEPGTDRAALEAAGFAPVAPGVLVSPHPFPGLLEAAGPPDAMRALAARAWPLTAIGTAYAEFIGDLPVMDGPPTPLDAMAARILLLHAFRRIALRDPHLPPGLLPPDWPGGPARHACVRAYRALAPAAEAWLDTAGTATAPLPPGPDPAARFGP